MYLRPPYVSSTALNPVDPKECSAQTEAGDCAGYRSPVLCPVLCSLASEDPVVQGWKILDVGLDTRCPLKYWMSV